MSIIHNLSRILGENTFFVPCEYQTKRPIVTYTERTFESTQSAAYLAIFEVGEVNIAVYLGRASAGLCSIDFDADADLELFLSLNASLRNTTLTRGSRGGMLWLRIDGVYPASCSPDHKHFEWRADKRLSTIYGRHPKGMDYRFITEAPPMPLSFKDIHWPPEWKVPWEIEKDQKLTETYGDPFYCDEKGRVTGINEPYWAGLHAKENNILFEKEEKQFYLYNENNGLYEVETEDSIRKIISARMLEASRQSNLFDLQKKRNARTLFNITTHLRGIAECDQPFNRKRSSIHLGNGVIIFKDNEAEMHSFSPDQKSRHRSPINFNPSAKCDRFLNELILPAVSEDDAELLQKFAGMFLLGYNRAQRLLILDGEAGRGKTQLANVMQGLIGLQNVTQLRTEQLHERFELFRYLNKTLLVGVDVPPDFLATRGASVIKGLVGGDWFDSEKKGGSGSYQFQGNFNVIITSNARLRVHMHGDIGAWKRRINIVRYEAPPPSRKINDFGGWLIENEGSGILNWAILGAKKLLMDIPEEGGDIKFSHSQKDIVDSLLAESDSLREFLQERVQSAPHFDVAVSEIVEEYSVFCPSKKWRPLPLGEIYARLEGLMLELFGVTKSHCIQRGGKSVRGYNRVRLRKEMETDEF